MEGLLEPDLEESLGKAEAATFTQVKEQSQAVLYKLVNYNEIAFKSN